MKQEVDQKEQEEAEEMKQVSSGTLENIVQNGTAGHWAWRCTRVVNMVRI